MDEPIWVEEGGVFNQMVENLATQAIIGVDTESNSLHAYREQVCLIQFSTPEKDYIVDPLALPDISGLGHIFANPSIEKVFHACEYDIICMKRDFNFEFANLFDTMVAGRILGRPAVGLGAMLETDFGIQLNKRFQRADWGRRPLDPEQIAYARLDTHFLLSLRDRLLTELKNNERWRLAQEDFQRLTYTNGHIGEPNLDQNLWRISGIQELTPQQAAVLRELTAFRDRLARNANQPAFKILSNQALLRVAQYTPNKIKELEEIDELSPRQVKRYGYGLLRAIRRGLDADPLTRPSMPRPSDKYLERLEALKSWRKQTAQAMGVESDVILPRDVLYVLAQEAPHDKQNLRLVMAQIPWRYERFGEAIGQVLMKGS